jgi:hypothetical protein
MSPEFQNDKFTYPAAKGYLRGRSLPLEMMHPDSINGNPIASFFDAPEKMEI